MSDKNCACCGNPTLDEDSIFDICPVCFWQDDEVQNSDPDYAGGANQISLNQAKLNFQKFGACEQRFIKQVKKLPK